MLRSGFALWSPRQWWTAAVGSVGVALVTGLPTDVIPNPVFGRPVPVTWWAYPALVVSSVLTGLLIGTYVRSPEGEPAQMDVAGRTGGVGAVVSFFAVGCPVCNKLVVLALGSSGALRFFQPLQPLLAVASVALVGFALRARLRGALGCPVPAARR